MKKVILNILVASLITLVAYLLLAAIWLTALNFIKNELVKQLALALLTAAAFAFALLYKVKIRGNAGDTELSADYRDEPYGGLIADLKRVARRERGYLVGIAATVLACFLLNTLDMLIFGKKILSFPTVFFAPMCFFSTAIPVPFVGYAVSALTDCALYLLFLLLFRRRRYRYWNK